MKSIDKKRFLLLLFIVVCFVSSVGCKQKNNFSPIASPADYFEITNDIYSNISKIGMNPAQFSISSEEYTQEFNSSDNIQFDGEKPYYSWKKYTSNSNAFFAIDEQGRIRKFRNSDDNFYKQSTDPKYSAEQFREIAHETLSIFIENLDEFQDSENSLICEYSGDVFYPCELYMKKYYSDSCYDIAYISLNDDGSVKTFSVSYCDIGLNIIPEIESDFEHQFQDYIQNQFINFNQSISDISKYYIKVNDDIYGCYSYSINIKVNDELGTVHDAKQVIFKSNV